MGEFDNIDEADITFASLDTADVIPVQMCAIRKLFLRKATAVPQLT